MAYYRSAISQSNPVKRQTSIGLGTYNSINQSISDGYLLALQFYGAPPRRASSRLDLEDRDLPISSHPPLVGSLPIYYPL